MGVKKLRNIAAFLLAVLFFSQNATVFSATYGVGYYNPGIYSVGADATSPVISSISSGTPNQATATITWTTNEAADSQVEYGLTASYGSTTTLDSSLVTSHSVPLSGLSSNTTYHYRVISADASSNTSTSSDQTFTTASVPDSTAPIRSNGSPSGALSSGTTSTSLSLSTDEASTCRYGTSSGVAYASMSGNFSTTGGTTHSTTIGSLSDGGSYSYYVRCIDSSSNANTSDYTISFSVDVDTDVTPPVLSNGAPTGTLASGTTATDITLTTDEAATCKNDTSSGIAYASMDNVFDSTGGTTHSTSLTGLANGTSYAVYIRCIDAESNANTSDYTISFSVANASSSGGGGGGGSSSSSSSLDVDAGLDQKISVSTATLTGAATVTTGSITEYTWKKLRGSEGVIVSPTSRSTAVTGLTKGIYTFEFTATDSNGKKAADTVKVEVMATGTIPVTTTSTTVIVGCTSTTLFSPLTGVRCPVITGTTIVTPTPGVLFLNNLFLGMRHSDVLILQKYLNANGFPVSQFGAGSIGNETMTFGPATKAAVIGFQLAKGISPASGYVGVITRTFINGTSTTLPAVQPASTLVTVTALNLNIRSTPVTGTVLGIVPLGTTGTVISTSGKWTEVRFPNGILGWVHQAYISS